MGPPPGAAPPASTSFAPQVMGPPPGAPGFAPQVMGAPTAAPSQPNATPLATPRAALPFEPALPFAQQGAQPPFPAAASSDPALPPPPAPPAMGAPMAAPPGERATQDAGLAASPWNRGNAGLDRDLLPSAMLAPPPEPAPMSKRPGHAGAPAPDAPSRAPWIIVGVLVLVAIGGGVVALQVRARRAADGPIAVPANGATASDDAPAETASPTAQPTASARPVPVARPVARPKAGSDDPYADVPVVPSKPKPAAPHRVFGTEN
jgi:hypothetical protein